MIYGTKIEQVDDLQKKMPLAASLPEGRTMRL